MIKDITFIEPEEKLGDILRQITPEFITIADLVKKTTFKLSQGVY